MRPTRATLRLALAVTLGFDLLIAPSALAKKEADPPAAASSPAAPGNLAIIDLKTYDIAMTGAERRILVRALIENQTPVNFESSWSLDIRKAGKGKQQQSLGSCEGENLPQGRVAVCEVWVTGETLKEDDMVEAALRRTGTLASWDRDSSDDMRSVVLRTTPERGNVLRIADWKLFPTILTGANEVQFEFTVEGSHLVWVLTPDAPGPRLLAGHPADGVLTGKGKERVKTSGPVTLVARNSLGAYVYQAVPVVHPYAAVKKTWQEAPKSDSAVVAAKAEILDAGVYDVPEDQVVLDEINAYLSAKDWAAEIKRMRLQVDGEPDPLPAGVLNPKAKERK